MNKKLKLIVVSGNLYRRDLKDNISSSGSDISMEEELSNIKEFSEEIHIVSLSHPDLVSNEKFGDNIIIHRVDEDKVKETIKHIHYTYLNGDTDYLLTQLLLCNLAIESAKELNIPIVYFMRSFGSDLPMSIGEKYEPDKIIACSKYAGDVAKEMFKKKIYVNYNTFNQSKLVVGNEPQEIKYDIVMFNPNKAKGGEILMYLAKKLPNIKFLAVQGWQDLKSNGKYDSQLMRLMSNAHGSDQIHIPEELNFSKIPNLEISEPQANPGSIIKMAKILIAPSQWQEAFGRVIVEAGLNGRIVIASNSCGVPEAMEIAGMPSTVLDRLLVDDYTNPDAWLETVKWVLGNYDKIPHPRPKLPKSKIKEILYDK